MGVIEFLRTFTDFEQQPLAPVRGAAAWVEREHRRAERRKSDENPLKYAEYARFYPNFTRFSALFGEFVSVAAFKPIKKKLDIITNNTERRRFF